MAIVKISALTDTSLSVFLDELQADYNGNTRTCEWYIKEVIDGATYRRVGQMTLANQISYSQSYKITGLKALTTYYVKASVNASGWSDGPFEFVGEFTTDYAAIKKFTWSETALNAFNNGGSTTDLTATEWNRLVDKVKEIYPDWADDNARAVRGDSISAVKFNYIANQVGYDTVEPGWTCLGRYFVELASAVNSKIGG